MDQAHRDILRAKTVILVSNLDVSEMLMAHLLQTGVLTTESVQHVRAERTPMGRARYLLDLIPKRGPNAFGNFVGALRNTGQSSLADILQQQSSQSVTTPPDPTPVADALIEAIESLKPAIKEDERSGVTYLTSAVVFANDLPKSSLGIREMPFLMACKSGLFGQDTVLTWPEAPTKFEFERQMRVYTRELEGMRGILNQLDGGSGLHIVVHPRDERIVKLVKNAASNLVTPVGSGINLELANLKLSHMTPADVALVECVLHLMCFGDDFELVVRKTRPPRPNAYLIYRASRIISSAVVMERDRQWVARTVKNDESVVSKCDKDESCPWLSK